MSKRAGTVNVRRPGSMPSRRRPAALDLGQSVNSPIDIDQSGEQQRKTRSTMRNTRTQGLSALACNAAELGLSADNAHRICSATTARPR